MYLFIISMRHYLVTQFTRKVDLLFQSANHPFPKLPSQTVDLPDFSPSGWEDVPVVAAETEGADCFSKALQAGRPVSLPDITR